jgi:predicted O-methyltransferase YrrM
MTKQARIEKLVDYVRKYGARETSERVVGLLIQSAFGPMLRRHHETPSVAEIYSAGRLLTSSPDELLAEFAPEIETSFINTCRSEFAALSEQLETRKHQQHLTFPVSFGVERGSAFGLYVLTRHYRPSVILETGVANGESTFLLLAALRANGSGRLHSVDVSDEVGCLLAEEEKEAWTLHVIDGSKAAFRRVLREVAPVDLFIHDSDHGYWWQLFELQNALKHMSTTGIIASDDCDKSYAFVDFSKDARTNPVLLHDTRKVFGLVRIRK